MQLDHAWIAARIPHQGSMCLLDRVLEWDDQRIVCAAGSHRAPDNPLRSHGRLSAMCGIEYAAQAMAVHGALHAAAEAPAPRSGMLASVRGVTVQVARLDDIAADLEVLAARVSGDANVVVYEFSVRADTRVLLSGRATVLLGIAATVNPG